MGLSLLTNTDGQNNNANNGYHDNTLTMSKCLLYVKDCFNTEHNLLKEGGSLKKLLMAGHNPPGELSNLQNFFRMQLEAVSLLFYRSSTQL